MLLEGQGGGICTLVDQEISIWAPSFHSEDSIQNSPLYSAVKAVSKLQSPRLTLRKESSWVGV